MPVEYFPNRDKNFSKPLPSGAWTNSGTNSTTNTGENACELTKQRTAKSNRMSGHTK